MMMMMIKAVTVIISVHLPASLAKFNTRPTGGGYRFDPCR